MKWRILFLFGVSSVAFTSCNEFWGKKPHVTTPYVLQIPNGFPNLIYLLTTRSVSKEFFWADSFFMIQFYP